MIAPLVLFILLIATVGFVFFKDTGLISGSLGAICYLALLYYFGPSTILKILKCKRLNILDKLSPEIKEFRPQIYLTNSIFSIPSKNICLTQDALDKLTKPELESLIMREIVQIRNGKSLEKFFWQGISGPLSVLFFRENTEGIDYETAKLTGDPEALASAIEKIYGSSQRVVNLRKL